jgi:starvation-inducible DNA-binding protein
MKTETKNSETKQAQRNTAHGTAVHATKIDLSESKREKLIALLNARLADAVDLRMQAKQAHWNVKGPAFIALHELFDDVATAFLEPIDEIAERAVQLGGTARGTVQSVSATTGLKPYPVDIAAGTDHVEALASALAAFGKSIRTAIDTADELGDKDTADLFTAVSRASDKYLWFVEAHQQAKS